jgi:hypothetical protein
MGMKSGTNMLKIVLSVFFFSATVCADELSCKDILIQSKSIKLLVKDTFYKDIGLSFKIHPTSFNHDGAITFFDRISNELYQTKAELFGNIEELKPIYFQTVTSTRFFLKLPIFMEIIDASIHLTQAEREFYLNKILLMPFIRTSLQHQNIQANSNAFDLISSKDRTSTILKIILKYPTHSPKLLKLMNNQSLDNVDLPEDIRLSLQKNAIFLLNSKAEYSSILNSSLLEAFDDQISNFLLLALGDHSMWINFPDRLNQNAEDFFSAGIFVDVFKKLPQSFQTEILKKIGSERLKASELYKNLTDNDLTKERDNRSTSTDAKRLLDYFFFLATRGDLLINELIESQGNTPKYAFEKYIEMVQAYYPSKFSSQQLSSILFQVTDYLNANEESKNTINTLVLGGSLFNGKASVIPNDYDMIINGFYRGNNIQKYVKDISKIVAENLNIEDIDVDHHANPSWGISAWTMLQGVGFEIKKANDNKWHVYLTTGMPGQFSYNLERLIGNDDMYRKSERKYLFQP